MLISDSNKGKTNSSSKRATFKLKIVSDGKTYYEVGTYIACCLSKLSQSSQHLLVNRRKNGGAASNDVRVIVKHPGKIVNVQGTEDHEIGPIPLVTAGGTVSTASGEETLNAYQYAYHPKCKIIHSSTQTKYYKNAADDRSIKVGGS